MVPSLGAVRLVFLGVHLGFVSAVREETSEGNHNPIFATVIATQIRNNERGRGGGGGGGGLHGYYDYAPLPEPEWTKMPLGCEAKLNKKLCWMALFFESTNSSGSANSGGISAVDMCNHIWIKERSFKGSGLSPRHYQCLAAAADEGLQRAAERYRPLRPENPGLYKDWDKEESLTGLVSRRLRGKEGEDWEPLAAKVHSYCEKRVATPHTQEIGSGGYGFCRGYTRPGQDCAFYAGIKENWDKENGRFFCNSIDGDGAKNRCLSLRKQLIRIGQAISVIGAVKWISFAKIEEKKSPLLQFEC